jgi:hypothetical protein
MLSKKVTGESCMVEGNTGERSKSVVEGNTGESWMFLVHVEQKSEGRELHG